MKSKQIAPRDSRSNAFFPAPNEQDRFYKLFCAACDPRLSRCSSEARWLLANLLDVMSDAEPFGHLLVDGRAPSTRQIAALCGGEENRVSDLIVELINSGFVGLNAAGVFYSHQLVSRKA